MQRRILLVAPFAALVVSLSVVTAACAGDDDSNAERWVARYAGEPNQDDALLSGTLVRVGNCLNVVFGPEPNGNRTVVFPSSAEWDDDKGVLRLGGEEHDLGEQVSFSGGFNDADVQLDWITPPDPSCTTPSIFIAGEG